MGRTAVAIPPDGGWGWAVVFASFMIHVIADGITYTFGLFFSNISFHLKASKSATAWVVSIMGGMTYGAGPLASAFVNRYGCRRVSITGSMIAGVGFGISYFANSVLYLYISVGLVGGLGLGLIYLPAIVSVTCYFEKRRSFATGVAVCGSGFGTMLLAPVIKVLLVHLSWNGAFLVTGGIILNCVVFSLMLKPVATVEVSDDEEDIEREQSIGSKSEVQNHTDTSTPKNVEDVSKELAAVRYIYYPHSQADSISTVSLLSPDKRKGYVPGQTLALNTQSVDDGFAMSSSQPNLTAALGSAGSLNRFTTLQNKTRNSLKMAFQNSGIFNSDGGDVQIRNTQHFNSSVTTHGPILERKDVFYSGSLIKMSELNVGADEKQLINILDIPILEADTPEIAKTRKICGCIQCSPRFYKVLTTMLSISLLKNPIFLLFAISNFFTSIGYNVPYIYLVDMAEENANHDKLESTEYLLSIVGIANTLSRIVLGYVSDKKWVNRLFLYNCALFLCGIATICAAFTPSMDMLRIYAATFGALVGVYVSLTSVILVDLLGLDKLTNAFGLLLLFQGIGTIIGPPIVGKLFDEFQDYRYGFGVAGAMIALSGLILFIIPCFLKRGQKKKKLGKKEHTKMEQSFASESLTPNSDTHNKKMFTNNNMNQHS